MELAAKLSVLTGVLVGLSVGVYALQTEEYQLVKIMAASDRPELGQPVYAQFVYRQTLVLPEMAEVTRVEVPMYQPDASLKAEMGFEQRGQEVEVVIDGGAISHEEKDRAPRVFVETDDQAYPDGNYRIASNEKKGDIGLTVWATRMIWQRWLAEGQDEPWEASRRGLVYVLLAFLLSLWPFAWMNKSAGVGQERDSKAE